MATKKIQIADLGTVVFSKRRNSRSIRISLSHTGEIRVSLPRWVSYFEAERFVKSKAHWIRQQQAENQITLSDNQAIGKYHVLRFEQADVTVPRGSVKVKEVIIKYPFNRSIADQSVQKSARTAAYRALKHEADNYLPSQLNILAKRFNFEVGSVNVKRLKSRWGSCNSRKDITLNSQLMLLPWHLINYVILHELTHTRIMKHGPDFWNEFEKTEPSARSLRKEIRSFKPAI